MYIIFDDDATEYAQKNRQNIIDFLLLNDEELTQKDFENDDAQTEDAIINGAYDLIGFDFDELEDKIHTYDKNAKYDCILCVADLGLWYGRRKAQKHFKNLYSAFHACTEDTNKVYFKRNNSAMILNAAHHDGTNIFKFYKIVNGKRKAVNYKDFILNY